MLTNRLGDPDQPRRGQYYQSRSLYEYIARQTGGAVSLSSVCVSCVNKTRKLLRFFCLNHNKYFDVIFTLDKFSRCELSQ